MTLVPLTTPVVLASVVAKGTLLLAVAWCSTLLLRRAPAGARHLVWLTVIVGVLLIPVLAQIAPVNVPILPSVATAPSVLPTAWPNAAARDVQKRRAATAVNASPSDATAPASTITRSRWTPNYATLAVALWFAVAVALLTRLLTGMMSVGRIIRRGHSVLSAEWKTALDDAAERLGIAGPARLVMSDQVEMAFACDALTPTIIIPSSAREWSPDRRRAVLLHELAHIRRRDLLGHIIASIACAVYWFNPLVWAAARRLRLESELASDDVVLASGVRATDYAQHLLDMVTGFGHKTPTVALAMARPKEFEGRLVAILDRANRRSALGRMQGGAMIGLLGLLTVSIAAVVPVPRVAAGRPLGVAPTPNALRQSESRESDSRKSQPRDESVSQRAASSTVRRTIATPTPTRLPAPLTDAAVATLLRYGTAGVINPMMMILRSADSLGLTGPQADSIATLNRRYMVRLNTIWSPVSSHYLAHPQASSEIAANDPIRRAPKASIDALLEIVPSITGLLTAEQRRALPARIAGYLDAQYLADIGTGRTSSGGVFLSEIELFGAGGARGSGRRGR
jgi:beta-lactamase regulating signal transducer with metallopeptidase domain